MKRLLPIRLSALLMSAIILFTSCSHSSQSNEDTTDSPTYVVAPSDPDFETTTAPPETEAPDTTDAVTDPPETTAAPIDTTAPSTDPSKDTTAAAQIVDPVIFTYRVNHQTDSGTYLLDADYNMSFVKADEKPIFHKTAVTRVGDQRVVYCSDLNTTLLITSGNEVLTVAAGRLTCVANNHWVVYATAQATKFRLFDIKSGKEFSGDLRGFNSRPDGKLVLLGTDEDIYISDGERIVDSRKYDIIYYFALTYALVREKGNLRFYNTNFELLADWGKISGSNRIKFDQTKRSDSGFEFFFQESSYKYIVGQDAVEGAKKIAASSRLTLLRAADKYLAYIGGNVFEVELPELSLIHTSAEGCLELLDEELKLYAYEITANGLKQLKLESKLESVGDIKLLSSNNPAVHSYMLDKSNKVLVSQYCSFELYGSFILAKQHGTGTILGVYTADGKPLETSETSSMVQLEDGKLLIADENRYTIYDSNGNPTLKSPKYDRIFTIVDEKLLVLEKTKLKLLYSDGKLFTDFGDISDDLDLKSDYKFHAGNGYSGLKIHETSGNPTFFFTFEGKRGGQNVAFEFTYDTVTGEHRRVDGVIIK